MRVRKNVQETVAGPALGGAGQPRLIMEAWRFCGGFTEEFGGFTTVNLPTYRELLIHYLPQKRRVTTPLDGSE